MMNSVTSTKPWASGPAEILQHAFELSRRNTDASRRLALLTTDNAVELMIKAYLGLPKRVTGINLPKKEYDDISESFPRLIEALERVAHDKTDGFDLGAVEWFHRLRNELYHNGNGLTVPSDKVTAYFELARLLYERLFEVALHCRVDETGLVARFIEAWIELYKTLQQMVGEELGEEFLQSTRSINDKLTANGYLDQETAHKIDEFRTIRNAVIHGDNYLLSANTLETLKSLSDRLRWQWQTGKSTVERTNAKKTVSSRTEKAWFYGSSATGHLYIFAMVNAKGSCSMRTFDAEDGKFLGKRYKRGNFQEAFASYLQNATELKVSRQPNLEKNCHVALPTAVLAELSGQISDLGGLHP